MVFQVMKSQLSGDGSTTLSVPTGVRRVSAVGAACAMVDISPSEKTDTKADPRTRSARRLCMTLRRSAESRHPSIG